MIPLIPSRAWSFAALLAAACTPGGNKSEKAADIYTVKRGDLRIAVKEAATLQAAKQVEIKSQLEGQATLIFLIKEGTQVTAGERLAELDASQLIERRATQEISLAKAEAGLVQAKKEFEILKKQNEADLGLAENNLRFALLDQEKFHGRTPAPNGTTVPAAVEAPKTEAELAAAEAELVREMGERRQQVEAAESDIKLAEADLKLAADRLEWSKRLFAKGYITKNELEKDTLDHERKKTEVVLAKNKKHLLVMFTHKKEEQKLSQDVRDAELELERVKAKIDAKIAQAEAEVRSAESEFRLAKDRWDNLVKQIENAVIKAPGPGTVIYATQGEGMRRQVAEEGAQVRERQTLIILPDTTKMIGDLSIHESQVTKVAAGQSVVLRVDALPGRAFTGTVKRVSPLPDTGQRMGGNDIKVYKTQIEIHGENEGHALRPGMSAEAEILVGVRPDVLSVPVQALQRDRKVNYLWVETENGPAARRVEVGAAETSFVEITSGIVEGDRVYMAAPSSGRAPAFEQPPEKTEEAPQPAVREPRPERAGGNGENVPAGEGQRPRGFAANPAFTEFLELVKQKRPDLTEQLANPMALFRDPELRAQLEEDPELKAKLDEMRSQMGGRRRGDGQGNGPGGGPGNAGRGGEGRGGENRGAPAGESGRGGR
jgi:multidrug resistance efflux pump